MIDFSRYHQEQMRSWEMEFGQAPTLRELCDYNDHVFRAQRIADQLRGDFHYSPSHAGFASWGEMATLLREIALPEKGGAVAGWIEGGATKAGLQELTKLFPSYSFPYHDFWLQRQMYRGEESAEGQR